MSFFRNQALAQNSSSPNTLVTKYMAELTRSCSEFNEIACQLQTRSDVLTAELIYSVAEEASFNALELARSLVQKDPQHFQQHLENVRLFKRSWNDLCTRRTAFLSMPAEVKNNVEEKVEKPSSDTAGALEDIATMLYRTAYDFHCLARDLAKHPEVLISNDLAGLADYVYSLTRSKMIALSEMSHLFEDYQVRFQRFTQAEETFKNQYIKQFLVDEDSLTAPERVSMTC